MNLKFPNLRTGSEKFQFQWLYTNDLLAIIFSFGLLYNALKSMGARSWLYVQNGSVCFLLSCYDAQVSYDSKTNSFTASYTAHGRPTTQENIDQIRLRPPVVNTPPFDLHVSDCLNELQPGDHIEIQWRKSKEFPYGAS